MPETVFRLRWPDGSEEDCYSPSSTIAEVFAPGESYPLDRFVILSRQALTRASDRVEAKYGFRCTSAEAQLAAIEDRAGGFTDAPDARVTCVSII